ncbi:MAG TPA: glutamate 5-kinase [Verrucomicrobia bacterium]|nr:MAG: glutamate 5-kinase [Lentisphaerae bacterium GWF2_57_35]HBA84629.1 glutamate 5-kinase [Verrucomicrobiota bacterium]
MNGTELRQKLKKASRIVVKVGSRVLVQRTGRPDLRRIKTLVRDLAALQERGHEVVLVSSGAIGTGVHTLGMSTRPTTLPELQMAAAVGQTRLMTLYDQLFSKHGCKIGQVLLTHADLNDRRRHLNARNTMQALLRNGIIPIVNENDVVAVDEIKFGDNDLLASLVALLIEADLLILLTTVDGFRMPAGAGRTRRVSFLEQVTDDVLGFAVGKGSNLSTGGMSSKLQAAGTVARMGASVVIANGRKDGILTQVVAGQDTGTLLANVSASTEPSLNGRKRWIAFFHKAQGSLTVDNGARDAIIGKGKSLLPIGIREVEGDFEAGAVVTLKTLDGLSFARGLTDYAASDIRQIKGRKTSEIEALLGSRDYDEVIHRDNLVVTGIENGS